MTPKTLMALVVASSCAWSAGGLAGGAGQASQLESAAGIEARASSAPDDAAPRAARSADRRGTTDTLPAASRYVESDPRKEMGATGATSGAGGSGSVGGGAFDANENVEYWLIGANS